MKTFALLAALLPAAIASPVAEPKVKADCTTTTTPAPAPKPTPNYCSTIDWLVSANHGQSYAASFCSSFLHVSTVTSTVVASTTVTGALTTVTSTLTSSVTPTVTSTMTSVVTSLTSSVSYTTSYCTPYSSTTAGAAATTSAASLHNRNYGGYPNNWCWTWSWPYPTTKYQPTDISSACSCLVSTPTAYVSSTSTYSKAGPTTTVTTTKTVYPTTSTVVSSVTSTTTSTKIISATEIEPADPTGRYQTNDGVTTFEEYSGIDFFSGDLQPYSPCACDLDKSGGNCVIGGTNYGLCTGFDSCQNICAAINAKSGNLTCAGVTYTGSDASGECYPKSSLNGCGQVADDRRSGLISLEGYKYA